MSARTYDDLQWLMTALGPEDRAALSALPTADQQALLDQFVADHPVEALVHRAFDSNGNTIDADALNRLLEQTGADR